MTNSFWEQIATADGEALDSQPQESRGVVVVSASSPVTAEAEGILAGCVRALRPGGWLFIYGHSSEVSSWGEHLFRAGDETWRMNFKYWIALGIDDAPRDGFLKPSHRGLLMFLKTNPRRKSPMPFHLNTAEVKIPHAFCAACKANVKDWGGKKHLMNPKGTALSDVWRDLPTMRLKNSHTPDAVLERIWALTETKGERGLHVIESRNSQPRRAEFHDAPNEKASQRSALRGPAATERDSVHLGDCVSFLEGVAKQNPEGVFDLAFADPPYNLAKNYDAYDDTLADQHYLDWCNQWLDGMARTLKPGGSLLVLNLPKWAIHHATFLNARLDFRHWIAWDALSDPRGKIMPAHYALLYYTKPGGKPVFNYSHFGWKKTFRTSDRPTPNPSQEGSKRPGALGQFPSWEGLGVGCGVRPPDSPKYCLRAACVKKRKLLGDDDKVELSDIWSDIHRIKHKRDRDAHPCQLPEKLMERIIRLTTNRGGLVFDPFCGAGTTVIAAAKLGRHFVTVDSDPKYVDITKAKLVAMKENADMFGEFTVPRRSTLRPRTFISKKAIETQLQQLAQRLGRVPTEEEIHGENGELLAAIDRIYPNRGAALKRCKVVL